MTSSLKTITRLQPLSGLEKVLVPILHLFMRGTERVTLDRRVRYTKRLKEHEAAERALQKKLAKEAKIYASLIIHCWARRGSAHFARHAHIATDGKPPKNMKVNRVKLARIRTTEEQLWFQIFVGRRFLFQYKDNLPFGVDVAELTSPEALYELSHICRRVVQAYDRDFNHGAWVYVNRLEGIDGLPTEVKFQHILPRLGGSQADAARGPFCLGSGENKSLYILHLSEVHHILIAGGSGGGKSNMIKGILSGLMRFCTPEQIQFIMIDPKRLELGMYGKSPHMMRPVVFKVEEVLDIFEEVLKEVYRRTELLFQANATDLAEYNENHPEHSLPRIVVVVDELAQLMLLPGREISARIKARITQIINMGRALGVHLILATQYPVVAVLPNAIKVNVGLTIAARTASKEQSKVIIGRGDAALLPRDIKGRMYCLNGADHLIVQTPHVLRSDVEEALVIAKGRQAGFITLEGHEPVIWADNVLLHVVGPFDGLLKVNDLWDFFEPYGVPLDGLKGLLSDLVHERKATVRGRSFIVEKQGKLWRVIEVFAERAPGDEFPMDIGQTLARWKMIRQPSLLMLPASTEQVESHRPEKVIDVTATVVSDRPPLITFDKSSDEVIDEYIKQHCVVSKKSKATSADLYSLYKSYCEQLGEPSLSKPKFGQALKARGFKPVAGHGVRFWSGIGIVEEEPVTDAALVT